ncbi:arginase family protein [Chitinophaga pinensis]|uniref:Arginase/agmatinase/formiminoglutamase n=1 Tax=Chitinophaga pinensis (strain ATCC 43595 / DSM 2588 / LMG 13176 / NBRC 15968 / NCIMB 11800 / UQM 2034) TaxID=485918 RepID=A0A979G0W5_CHIPD|nr:arginase family protein [Chitinophaga pinensis]ACU58794.1 Arginase/agmatinase/formiminoglutamase [Chitinophaga pinensis DSM 2588]
MRNFMIIEAPSNLGLKEPRPGVEPGVRFLPEALRRNGFSREAGITQVINVPAPPYTMDIDPDSQIRNADAICAYSQLLAERVCEAVQKDIIPIVIGGDCSILIGTALGLKSTGGSYGLFSMDGHHDYMLPFHSGTAGAAGMGLAIVSGNGHPKLCDIHSLRPYIMEQHIYAYGNRELDEEYVQIIRDSQVHYYDLPSIRARGIQAITTEFLTMMGHSGLDGFWIHLDVDVLDNDVMPCVDSPEEGGLSYLELEETLIPLVNSGYFKGMHITILDPTLDPDNRYTRTFSERLAHLLRPVVEGLTVS